MEGTGEYRKSREGGTEKVTHDIAPMGSKYRESIRVPGHGYPNCFDSHRVLI